ncbi:hypothetical protein NQ315_010413, partial [Exocentrus adspersus]
VQGEAELEGPSESECRPYIEKALKELETGEPADTKSSETGDSREDIPTVEISDDTDRHQEGEEDDDNTNEDTKQSGESVEEQQNTEQENIQENEEEATDANSSEDQEGDASDEQAKQSPDDDSGETGKEPAEDDSKEEGNEGPDEVKATDGDADSKEDDTKEEESSEQKDTSPEANAEGQEVTEAAQARTESEEETKIDDSESKEGDTDDTNDDRDSKGEGDSKEGDGDSKEGGSEEGDDGSKEGDSEESVIEREEDDTQVQDTSVESTQAEAEEESQDEPSKETAESGGNDQSVEDGGEDKSPEGDSKEKDAGSTEDTEDDTKGADSKEDDTKEDTTDEKDDEDESSGEESESVPEEELSLDVEIPTELRPRDHVEKLLKLDEESSEIESIINRVSEVTLKELKKLYENAIKPLEVLYKYRDLSNRHFGDAEIFSKPLILFMGPWSGGKSSIINYLVNNEYNETALKTGAEPSPAYFNILMYGEEPEIIEGTELAADFTFSGLQKFGQGLEERLRGVKLPNKLLEKVNIVEIPGILEVRKQVSRVFPFNDACQWFIDRADIIFLVYDPSKLDVGPETEAILDQLKGREHQTRIILNKADQVKPEELMRVQGALIWNISPLMSSPQPPIMYTTSLWSRPYEPWAPVKLLQAQERAFLRDLRGAIDKRIENKIASARRFAVRVRNHAKMVDCYLTTYYNHKSVFGNKKQVANEIIDHPQDYHIYEGLSTLTNISRYDLPDPDVYRDFFKLNPLYDFQQLSATCTYFRGCPINRLDIAIAYDLPELVGTHKKLVENAVAESQAQSTAVPGS